MLRRALLGAALALACVLPAHAQQRAPDPPPGTKVVVIRESWGGVIQEYIDSFEKIRDMGARVAIIGECASACTLVLGIVPRDRICAGPDATLSFHSTTYWPQGFGPKKPHRHDEMGTELMRAYYAEDVRAAVRKAGWDLRSQHPELIPVKGDELRALLQPCG